MVLIEFEHITYSAESSGPRVERLGRAILDMLASYFENFRNRGSTTTRKSAKKQT